MTLQFIDEIPKDMFTTLNKIGSGSISDIYSAVHFKTNTEIALKIALNQNKEAKNSIDQDIAINKTLNHPFICKFLSESNTEHLKIIAMELIDGVSLLDYVNKRGRLKISESQSIFAQLLILIEYLQVDAQIPHCQLNPKGIMIDNNCHIRLIDFKFQSDKPNKDLIPYLSPEVLSGENHTPHSDIWSLGVILYYLIQGKLPFDGDNSDKIIQLIQNSTFVLPTDADDNLSDLITKMLNKDPHKRPTIDEIKTHPFIRNEKILNVDYKRLFSPTQNLNDSRPETINQLKCYKHDANIKISTNSVSPIYRKSHSKSLYTPEIHQMSLHEKVNLQTHDMNLLIESRSKYSESLNSLIQSAFDPNSKYCLNKFKTRRKISMTQSLFHTGRNSQSLSQNSSQLKLEKKDDESPILQLLNSSNALQPNPLQKQPEIADDSPMSQLLRSNDSASSHLFKNQPKSHDTKKVAPLNQLLRSSNSLSCRSFREQCQETFSLSDFQSSSSGNLDQGSTPSGIKSTFSFRRIQAPSLALNRKPSVQKFSLNDGGK